MKIPMSDGGVPFVVTYRKILQKPKIKRQRRFVGFAQLAKNLVVKVIETFESSAFETTTEYLDPGQSVAVHWAIGLEDPFDTRPGVEKNLVAYRMENDIPPSGLHFEVFMAQPKMPEEMSPEEFAKHQEQRGPQTNLVTDLTPEQFEMLRRRQQQEELLSDARDERGAFRRPPAPEYGRRPVRTIDEEAETPPRIISGEEGEDEELADLDGPGRFGEDD